METSDLRIIRPGSVLLYQFQEVQRKSMQNVTYIKNNLLIPCVELTSNDVNS